MTDLSLSGANWTTRAAADPYFTQSQVTELVRAYLNGADPGNPSASPLHADLAGLPPILVQVGDDEVLLDDSVRFVDRALAAGVDAQLDVWEGMVHGFQGSVGLLNASTQGDRADRVVPLPTCVRICRKAVNIRTEPDIAIRRNSTITSNPEVFAGEKWLRGSRDLSAQARFVSTNCHSTHVES